jgi:hypothetical protein
MSGNNKPLQLNEKDDRGSNQNSGLKQRPSSDVNQFSELSSKYSNFSPKRRPDNPELHKRIKGIENIFQKLLKQGINFSDDISKNNTNNLIEKLRKMGEWKLASNLREYLEEDDTCVLELLKAQSKKVSRKTKSGNYKTANQGSGRVLNYGKTKTVFSGVPMGKAGSGKFIGKSGKIQSDRKSVLISLDEKSSNNSEYKFTSNLMQSPPSLSSEKLQNYEFNIGPGTRGHPANERNEKKQISNRKKNKSLNIDISSPLHTNYVFTQKNSKAQNKSPDPPAIGIGKGNYLLNKFLVKETTHANFEGSKGSSRESDVVRREVMLRSLCKGDSWFDYYTIWDIAKEIIINVNSERLSLDFIHLLKSRIIDINDDCALNYIKSLLFGTNPNTSQDTNTETSQESYANLKYEFLSIYHLANSSNSQRLSILSKSEFFRRTSSLRFYDIFDFADTQLSFIKTFISTLKNNASHPSAQLNPENYYTFISSKRNFRLRDLRC